ncbi:hypothetical protein COU19_03510 [Candidatus Kaiserbacteria bacterium CG10_big_fil_rev_8_21_14_0_10_56_12]|uniref:PI-PLC Y-box domain-containing protein n=1 Tax=Candidatus Kaiserbacteria bacterium CG10_big_fil_rev_8_21_14_0_10_56_12 TaxID=1974611 RepID=A0A2H0U960_9BACT|nr:MAG: hypothetical protein COU19_03510 [Candidatus Kaiserbacteria bacterium CG10_big_fil_rev_8_21_14_0_10_56_12]
MKKRGSILILVLVFGSIFFILLASLASFVLEENRAQDTLIGRVQSLSVAEAGLNYYAWFLAHFPSDLQNGTGAPGPYVVTYTDTSGSTVGTYELSIASASSCGSAQTVDITSTGTSASYPAIHSTLLGEYSSPSVAQYGQITSAAPPAGVSFASLASDFASLKSTAQASGIYLEPHAVPQDPHLGYHLIFNADGTVTIRLVVSVKTLRTVQPVNNPGHYSNDYTVIDQENSYETLALPSDCGLIFSEDNTWVEGVIPKKVTLVVGSLSGSGSSPDAILLNDITYVPDSSAGLTLIGEHNILIAPNSPQNMELNGIFVTTNGYFGRNNYYYPSGGCTGLYEPRGALTIHGTIVSNYTPLTSWSGGCGSSAAGYQTQALAVDGDNAVLPPLFTPTTSALKTFVRWQQLH